jgi:multidrug efflux pump subunit AcrB
MIDKIERNRLEGMELQEATIRGSLSRVRPILMTAGTTILTLLPLAFTHGTDTVISQTLGIVVIGGMITSTLNSFLVIPPSLLRSNRVKWIICRFFILTITARVKNVRA